METKLKFDAQLRTTSGKEAAKKLRDQGLTPAIIYGMHKENRKISFRTKEFLKLVHGEAHENMIFKVNIDGDKKDSPNVIIKEIQRDPIKSTLVHVDFLQIDMTMPIQVHIPVKMKGEAIGVKDEGGLLDHICREILIECLPNDLPENIEVDVTDLKLGDSLHIKDIKSPPKIKILEGPEKVVFSVIHKLKAKTELVSEMEVTEEVAGAEPEVLSQKSMKKEEKE